jgi:hypothetical protein
MIILIAVEFTDDQDDYCESLLIHGYNGGYSDDADNQFALVRATAGLHAVPLSR